MATFNFFDGPTGRNGRLAVSLVSVNDKDFVWTDIHSPTHQPTCGYGLTPDQARAYAAELIAQANGLDQRARQQVISCGLTAKQHAALEEAVRNAPGPQRPRHTVLVAAQQLEFDRWCEQNFRNPRDQTITRITHGCRDAHKLQGITDFDLFVLSEIPHHNEAMALLSHRLRTTGQDPSQ